MSNQNLNDLKYKQIENQIEPNKNPEFNPSYLLSFNAAGECVYIDETIGSDTYRTTLTRSDMAVTSTLPISAVVKI